MRWTGGCWIWFYMFDECSQFTRWSRKQEIWGNSKAIAARNLNNFHAPWEIFRSFRTTSEVHLKFKCIIVRSLLTFSHWTASSEYQVRVKMEKNSHHNEISWNFFSLSEIRWNFFMCTISTKFFTLLKNNEIKILNVESHWKLFFWQSLIPF